LMHEKKERESAKPGAQPPEPDLSFVLHSNPRITFAMDAKVVEKDRPLDLTDYVDTVNGRFVTCVYAPFSAQGAMLAFLLEGSIKALFQYCPAICRTRIAVYDSALRRSALFHQQTLAK
jgi:hypothetical protein